MSILTATHPVPGATPHRRGGARQLPRQRRSAMMAAVHRHAVAKDPDHVLLKDSRKLSSTDLVDFLFAVAEDEHDPKSTPDVPVVSPLHLRVPTLGEMMKQAWPASRNVAVSGKDRAVAMMGGRKRDQPAAAAIAGGKAGLRLQRRDLLLQGNERLKLELLLVVPPIRQMRHQRPEQAAAGTRTDSAALGHDDGEPRARCHERRPQAHDPGAHHQHVGSRLTEKACATIH